MKIAKASGTLGLVAIAALGSPLALAQDAGWYAGINAGQSRAKIDDRRIIGGLLAGGFTTTSIEDDDRDAGFKVFGGYRINRNFALEGGYFDLGKFGFKAVTLPPGVLSGRIKVKGLNLDLVGSLPITDRFSAFARVGVNHAQARDTFAGTGAVHVFNTSPSKRDTNLKVGLGLQYAFTEALAVRAEVERYRINDAVGNKGDIDLVSVGLVYSFDRPTAPVTRTAMAPDPAPVAVAVPPPPVANPPPSAPLPLPAPRFERYTLSATELFGFDRDKLRMPQPKLDEIATALGGHNEVNRVVIIGYADRIGSDQYNQKLSERRAMAVKNYLVSKGISGSRLDAQGRGEANPVVVCNDKIRPALIKCLEPNRRVEVEQIIIERRLP